MDEISTREKLKLVTEKVTGLPTLPKVIQEITNLMQNPRTSAEEVGRAITMDQALASKVLRLVNSAFYGFPGRINTITHAIVILGFNTVKNIVLTASVFDKLGGLGRKEGFDLEKFWLHSIATGVIAKEIAKKINFRYYEESFLAGLLHDIGKIILIRFLPEEFDKVAAVQRDEQCLFLEAEKKAIDLTHNEIGNWLAQRWNLPEDLRAAILYHHAPMLANQHKNMIYAVHTADALARALCIGSGGDNKMPTLHPEVWEELKFSRQLLDKIYKDIETELDKAAVFFQIM
ncbi:MAG: HDOD domain-containing protein [Fibrobacterota bacterium]